MRVEKTEAITGYEVGDMTAWVGDYNMNIADGESAHKVCSLTVHPQFNDERADNDLSILHLCQPLQFNQSISENINTRVGHCSAQRCFTSALFMTWNTRAIFLCMEATSHAKATHRRARNAVRCVVMLLRHHKLCGSTDN